METEPIRSPFYEPAASLGATFMEEGGWYWTDGFGDADGEYEAVRDGLGVWDVSPLNKWEFRGPDALRAAQRVHSNNILGLAVGQVRYGAFCDSEGLMVDDGTVYRLGDRVWVMTNGSEHADHFAAATAGLAVEIEAITATLPHLGLQGPRARDALGPLCEADVDKLGYFRFYPEPTEVGCVLGRGGPIQVEISDRLQMSADLRARVQTGLKPLDGERVVESAAVVGEQLFVRGHLETSSLPVWAVHHCVLVCRVLSYRVAKVTAQNSWDLCVVVPGTAFGLTQSPRYCGFVVRGAAGHRIVSPLPLIDLLYHDPPPLDAVVDRSIISKKPAPGRAAFR